MLMLVYFDIMMPEALDLAQGRSATNIPTLVMPTVSNNCKEI